MQVRHRAHDGSQADCDTVDAQQLLAHGIAVAAVPAKLDCEPLTMRGQATGPLWRFVGLPAALAKVAPDSDPDQWLLVGVTFTGTHPSPGLVVGGSGLLSGTVA